MKYTSFYTVKEQNYKAVESILPNSNLPADVQEVMKKIIEDHKALVKQQKKIIEEQNAHASAHFSTVASVAALRYQCGMASYRLENMSDAFGIKISDSTQWYLFENAASLVRPFVNFLEKEVANAPVQHIDDTKILFSIL